MLERKIIADLQKWKNRKKHKSLIITGQRQIGKTYIIREAFSKEYKSYIEIDFVRNPEMKSAFADNLDVESMLMNISLQQPGHRFLPGETLVLLDEIQQCPEAIASLKYWTEDGRFDVIGMGSALGMKYQKEISYPVGYVEYLDMHSLDFEEFLWAMGIDKDVIASIRNCFEKKKVVPAAAHTKMMQYIRFYMTIGGMPEVVNEYLETHNMSQVHVIQCRLLQDYKNHIAQYASPDAKVKASKCYDTIPMQLSKDNHKFQYSKVEKKATATKYGESISWLCDQLLLIPVMGLKRIEFPLKSFADETNFRLYPTDIGMLMAAFDESLKRAIIEDGQLEKESPGLLLGTAKGGLYEALAADMLYKNGYRNLYFYKHEKNTSEIEFVMEKDGDIVPIEIKAGRKMANSLKNILQENHAISYGYKMSSNNLGEAERLVTMPIYMLMFF